LESIIAFQRQAQQDLEKIESAGEQIQKLTVIEQELMKVLSEKALLLSNQRKAASQIIAKDIENQLDELKMTHARFVVDMKMREHPAGLRISEDLKVDFDANGIDQVEFLVETNPGEGFKPLVKIASGGEVSRFMLALKNVLAEADTIPSLVFDEIDQGIGGRIGLMVGEKLWHLSQNHQVLCVTHLPQLAAYGDQHFNVMKLVHDNRTQTEINELTGEARQKELASMLGPTNQTTLNAAGELLESVSQSKGKINQPS
jgi:DNA repair protein RecN (Recombination protein N)